MGLIVCGVKLQMSLLSYFYPQEVIDSAYDIKYDSLYEDGYRGIIFDVDNTLVPHGAPPDERSVALLRSLSAKGYKILFLSNNKEPRVKSFRDDALPEGYYIYKGGKPKKDGYLKAMSTMGTDVTNTLFVGDQLFTDIWGAKRCGIRSILTRPIHPKEEIQIVLKRILERIILKSYYKSIGKEKKNANSCY